MSLEVSVYTIDEDGQRRTVRGLDLMKIQKEWLAQEVSSEEITLRFRQLLAENEVWRNLAGPEVWRTTVYGSDEARSLGLTLLPSLSHSNIDVQGEDLDRLGKEINLLIQNVALFAAIPPPLVRALENESDEILARFTNIANAVIEAKELNGGVNIS